MMHSDINNRTITDISIINNLINSNEMKKISLSLGPFQHGIYVYTQSKIYAIVI